MSKNVLYTSRAKHSKLWFISFQTIVAKELNRFLRIWLQTLLPPAITMSLYFLIFGSVIGNRIGEMSGINYMSYIAPGIIMMAIITNTYGNVVSSFFGAKFQRHIEEILVSPTPNIIILAGYVTGGVCRILSRPDCNSDHTFLYSAKNILPTDFYFSSDANGRVILATRIYKWNFRQEI